jgi:hypothetical protein
MKRRGRQKRKWAPRQAAIKRGEAISCRVPTHVHTAITQAADRRGWTVSAEAAQRLEDSLLLPNTPTAALMQVVACTIDAMSRDGKTWLNDRYLHQEAQSAIATALRLVRPKEHAPEPRTKLDLDDPRPSGRIGFELLWSEIRTFVPGRLPPPRTTGPKAGTRAKRSIERLRYERQLVIFREGLGKLLDRAVLWGLTGRQARELSKALSVEELHEFADLSRKRITEGLSDKEHERFIALHGRYPGKETLNLGDLSSRGPFGRIISTSDDRESKS